MEIVEPHMYDVDDAVAKIDGYIISIAGASPHVGEKRMVRIEQVGRTAASALLLDENGEVVRPAPRPRRAPPAPQRPANRAPRPNPSRPVPVERRRARRTARPSTSSRRSEPNRRPIAETSLGLPSIRAAGGGRRGGCRTIQTSAPWPQGRTAPFGCKAEPAAE